MSGCPGGTNAGCKILVLLPSLALLRQTLHEWLRETRLPSLAYLCVCSDPTVKEGIDALTTQQSDLDFQVSTDTASVRRFLNAPFAGVKMIFSTYQSASVVGAAMPPGEAFDFAVFDEAHKTAGREGRNFAFALDDKNLSIRKRLFVTATPRHYNPHDRDREGEAKLLFSMDNPAVYGPQAYRLTFAEAARRGIICGYKVIISVITSEMVTNELLSHGEVLVNGDAVRARQVANQIALHDAIEKYGVKKVFTFHRDVKSAQSFVSAGLEGVGTHLNGDGRAVLPRRPDQNELAAPQRGPTDDFQTFHVNGSMPTARRERELRDFRAAARAIVSNARCLTEGVDVPAVDMVAFLSPRRSRVDIVQATGRAMRRSPGKTTGYVLVPLYVELTAGETVEAAVNRAQFDEVWDVLHSIQEQDDVLADLIRYVGEQKGQGKGFDDSRFADRIDFGGPRLGLESLRAAVTTHCLEDLYSSWDTWYGKLKAFKEQFGHCNVETDWEEDPALAGWVSAQRTRRNKGLLYSERIRLLDELGFVWDFQTLKGQETWMKWYRELESYVRQHGNPHITRSHANTKLASWAWIQRQRRRGTYKPNGKDFDVMTAEQISLLDKLGFRWDAREEKWTENFEKLKTFSIEHGHCEVGLESNGDEQLADWTHRQRWLCKRGSLNAERKSMLETIGFKWSAEAIDLQWREMFERLKEYHAANGDADVPFRWKNDLKLAAWVSHQRERRKRETLSDEEIKLLDSLGFTWKSRDVGTWEDRLAEVAAFKAKHGHCEMPMNMPDNPKLGRFVNNMRTQRNSGRLSADRIAKLDALGFAWGSSSREEVAGAGINRAWKKRFDELLQYRNAHGNCDVPNEWCENPQLGHWVNHQRGFYKRGKLHPERQRRLDEIGFDWHSDSRLEEWATRFAQLKAYKDRFGNCRVPVKWQENPQLGKWVAKQRHELKKGRLSPEKVQMLHEIGFE
jgi:superfamily II DNA or RNA helicase